MMGKDGKEESAFGFKDRAKAEETLRLLEAKDHNYSRLTVRGLLGRARRTLTLTKAEDKIKNIKEAIEVFEKWLSERDGSKEKKDKTEKKTEKKKEEHSDKESSDDEKASLPSESVPGLGFKDRAAAEASLRILEGRDPEYQLLAVKGLIRNAKRVLTCTRDETKLSNIKESISLFEKFIDEYDTKHSSRDNCPYLSIGVVRTAANMAARTATELQKSFLSAYESVKGEYKRLRNVTAEGDQTWDIVRNRALKELREKYADIKLFNEKDEPTSEHLEFMLWAYSPEPSRVKKLVKETQENRKRKSSGGEESESKKMKE